MRENGLNDMFLLLPERRIWRRQPKFFLNKNYGGSCAKMLAMLSGGEKPDENEIEALRQMLKEWEKQ